MCIRVYYSLVILPRNTLSLSTPCCVYAQYTIPRALNPDSAHFFQYTPRGGVAHSVITRNAVV